MSLTARELRPRQTIRLAALVCLALAVGCTGYRPLSRAPLPRDEVRMTFLSPRNLVGRTESGRSVPLNSVTEVRGRIAAIAADSVRLFLASARGPDGELGGIPTDVIVAIPRDWYPLVQERYTSVKPLKWVGYAALGVLAVLVLAVGVALDDM